MYFKLSSIRMNPITGNLEGYYRLVESYRNSDNKVCHRTLLNIGFMGDITAEELNTIQKILTQKCQCIGYNKDLFGINEAYEKASPVVQKWVDALYVRLVSEKKIDISGSLAKKVKPPSPVDDEDWQTINISTSSMTA